MKMYVRFLLVWAINSIVLLLANAYYPANFVLGNAVMTPTMAGILTGFLLTLLLRVFGSFSRKPKSNRFLMFVYYFLANSFVLWLLARISVVTGFGIPSFKYAFYLGFVVCLVQWLVRQAFKKLSLS
jgi:uncharacterized membrane protein YvlD (DUF360 family)